MTRQQRRSDQGKRKKVVLGVVEVFWWILVAAFSIVGMTLMYYDIILFAVFSAATIIGALGLILGFIMKNFEFKMKLPPPERLAHIGLATSLGFAISVIFQAIYVGFGPLLLGTISVVEAPFIVFAASTIAIGVWEETFNCLFIQITFERLLGVWPSIIIRTAFFVIFHMIAYSANPIFLGAMAIMGFFIGFMFYKTRSLAVAYGMHAFQNIGGSLAQGGLA